ncbi:macro domain-containing protein, partial [Salmonella sp. s54412]|uniref:macro domain-containing protein n=1 Tax=Salmonella sp. s54412 TaxID=3160128 RepID=UPI0037544D52
EVDAVVNPTNGSFSLTGEVGTALKKAGSSAFEEEVKNLAKDKSPLEVGDAAICPGHNFPAKFVIHVHSPSASQKDALEKIETAVKNILVMADEKNLKSIALPSIGSG